MLILVYKGKRRCKKFSITAEFSSLIQLPILNFRLVTLKIYDVLGKEVATIVNKKLPAGDYNYQWNTSGFASGVYFSQLKAGDFVRTKKLILMK
jgi:hypothetical protein